MRILFVGTGNICRSAVAERLSQSYLDAAIGEGGRPLDVLSAGSCADVGSAMHPASRSALGALGGTGAGFVAQQLDADLLRPADLVLTMTERLRDDVLRLNPTGLRRTFTLREAADLLAALPAITAPLALNGEQHARTVVMMLADARRVRRAASSENDVSDPSGEPVAAHHRVVSEIAVLLQPLLHALVLPEYASILRTSTGAAA
ncbi:low molecular weight phosphatase family protein [Modestobacter sp. I12A-02628]|uniref:Low molecular weight phosphatase family protein n=1 Tax=Goekera deserti TaxID=2497753 RepID=A0A7K3WH44_9ACTN|nr:low molecular weight phosphatase family protein [Goekera deserti]MPQ97935.1 low molecular weight phosphatase family protein [Goekera deserti]NDI48581.1 low molecular weight phosphatase family protein [Goekera deserti]NEL55040.1 low molecular weight phosphatase family protein [Goekera deserti]